MANNGVLPLLLLAFVIEESDAISCYDCRSEDVSCNVGECVGTTCVKLETSNIDNDHKTVLKSCSNEFEDNQCKQSYLGPKIVLRCTCNSNFCNGDRNLAMAGLQRMPENSGMACAKAAISIILIPILHPILLYPLRDILP